MSTPSQTKVNAIMYVSTANQNSKGFLNDSGLVGISAYVDNPNTLEQKIMNRCIEIPPNVDVLFTKKITKSCWRIEPDFTTESMEERYKENIDYEIAIIHDKFRGKIDVPNFLNSDLMKCQTAKIKMNEEIERNGDYGLFHMGGPVVLSSDGQTSFAMNDEELDLFRWIMHGVLYYFEDSNGRKAYKELLEKQEKEIKNN